MPDPEKVTGPCEMLIETALGLFFLVAEDSQLARSKIWQLTARILSHALGLFSA